MSLAAALYERMQVPDSALVDKRVFKKQFLEHGDLTATDKTALSENVEQVLWRYSFSPSTVAIAPYADDEHEYLEVALLEVCLRQRKGVARIAELIHRTVPYPLLIVFVDDTGIAVSTALKRLSRSAGDSLVTSDLAITPWSAEPPKEIDLQFFDSLRFSALHQGDFSAFYHDLHSRVVARNCGEVTGIFRLGTDSPQARAEGLSQVRQVEKEIERARREIRQGASIARSVELNTQIQDLKQQLARESKTL